MAQCVRPNDKLSYLLSWILYSRSSPYQTNRISRNWGWSWVCNVSYSHNMAGHPTLISSTWHGPSKHSASSYPLLCPEHIICTTKARIHNLVYLVGEKLTWGIVINTLCHLHLPTTPYYKRLHRHSTMYAVLPKIKHLSQSKYMASHHIKIKWYVW